MADDCKKDEDGNDNQHNISVSKIVKTPVFHVVDRDSIRRQGKLFQVYKGFYEIKGTSSDVKQVRQEKTWPLILPKSSWK